ncbi:hypothetical protein ASG84_12730 [Rhodococcus sp. Leaf278]|uniref:hypothetical protein n=1 Tax=Rhodococcus sp. Leaf278 TaxID=1736319 RepID=UPI00070EA885|nr:hypothetical protein [Rhodococcus sp. Leaf278]KQU44183.1 hypothetical protein ASG84_12730 [Rhodococcus sp. Leaf278]
MTTELRHVWAPDGTTLCQMARSADDVKLEKPTPNNDASEMCAGCVIAVEIYISVVKGTIVASRPPALTAAQAIDSLRGTKWADTIDLDALARELADGRTLRMYDPVQWVH